MRTTSTMRDRWRNADTGPAMLTALVLFALAAGAMEACGAAAQGNECPPGWTCSTATLDELAVDPEALVERPELLEVRLVHADDCAPGWRRVALEDGWVVPYITAGGYRMPNWVSDRRLAEHFRGPDDEINEVAVELARQSMAPATRVTCRWEPYVVLEEAAR